MLKKIILFLMVMNFFANALMGQVQLQVGDPAPAIAAYQWLKGDPINNWKDKQFYLVEFGATWCKPCAAAIPKLNAIAKEYPDKLQVASIFVMEQSDNPSSSLMPSYVPRVQRYIEKRSDQMTYAIAVDGLNKAVENAWLHKAGLSGIPHSFLISKGRIIYIGSDYNAIRTIIDTGVNNSTEEKRYNPKKLLLIDDNGGRQEDFYFRSILTPLKDEPLWGSNEFVQSTYWLKPDSLFDYLEDKVQVFGRSIGFLYYIAYADTFFNQVPVRNYLMEYPDTLKKPFTNNSYGKYWYEPILEVTDPSVFESDWKNTRNRFNYSLKVPAGTGTSAFLQAAMQNDLKTYFGYDVSVETRAMPCWELSIADAKKLKAIRSENQLANFKNTLEPPFHFTNADTRDVLWMLGSNFGYGYFDYGKLDKKRMLPYIDKTNWPDKFDFTHDPSLNFDQFVNYLRSIGFELTKSTKPMKVVVIRDPKS